MLFEYYACVAETQYPAAHAGLLQNGALCSGPAHQRNCFFQFNQALCALREYCINPRNKVECQETPRSPSKRDRGDGMHITIPL
jgi:hypothetical protein